MIKTIGILGAGKVGIVLAQLALKAGYTVLIASSGDPAKIALTVRVLAQGAIPLTKEEVARQADVIILALPLAKYHSIPRKELEGKLVIDAMNHWWEVDGPREDILPEDQSSSEMIQEFLLSSQIVKAFSHMGYHELHDEARLPGVEGRKSIALAGDDESANKVIADIINQFGFDPLGIGTLKDGILLEPGHAAFGASLSRDTLKAKIDADRATQ